LDLVVGLILRFLFVPNEAADEEDTDKKQKEDDDGDGNIRRTTTKTWA
jgi:hypothetical protein